MSAFVAAAEQYTAMGWRVLPVHSVDASGCNCRAGATCRSAGKHPRTAHGAHDATRHPACIAAWAKSYGDTNIAIATGRASDLLVLDVDPRNGGTETFEELRRELGQLPPTPEVLTGGGGLHLFFRAPLARVRAHVGRGFDIKFEGGYVVAPPSRHTSGRLYAWARGRSPSETAVAALPDAWVRALSRPVPTVSGHTSASTARARSSRERRARAYVRRVPRAISGQHGHTATFHAAVLVARGFDLDGETAFRVLREEWNDSCEPPWSDKDLRRKVEQALEHSTAPRGFLLEQRRSGR